MLEHGGRLLRAARRYGIAAEHWLDLSTGVSPFPWPVPVIPEAVWQRLPEDDDGLIEAARQYYAAPALLPVSGSQAAIQTLPRLRAHSRVGVIAPGYAEHAHAWREAGHAVDVRSASELIEHVDDYDVLVLIHPNNPGGDTFGVDALLDLHARLAARGGWLIVDEAFMDATPEASLCPQVGLEGLVVLRSVGKFFGMAGARAGFACAWPDLLDALRERLGPWTLTGPTRWALRLALQDVVWQRLAITRLHEAAAGLQSVLSRHGLAPSAGTAMFQWVRSEAAAPLHDALAQRGILTRLFDTPPSLRFGLPPDTAGLARLDAALFEVMALRGGDVDEERPHPALRATFSREREKDTGFCAVDQLAGADTQPDGSNGNGIRFGSGAGTSTFAEQPAVVPEGRAARPLLDRSATVAVESFAEQPVSLSDQSFADGSDPPSAKPLIDPSASVGARPFAEQPASFCDQPFAERSAVLPPQAGEGARRADEGAVAPIRTTPTRTAHTLMVQGTTSDAGKSTLVAALCRWLYRQGVAVAPFKPQNMALNSAVTADGGEIGRAQAAQAQACGLAPQTDFNPVLLKPNSDTGAQVIVNGRAVANLDAVGYHAYKRTAREAVLAAHARLCQGFDVVMVEGAGSPAEINLRANDIANMGFAEAVDCPVILVADIDRGGVFAHLVGTLALLSPGERARVAGFVINRFRGDLALLQPGLDWLERETGKPVLGVLPYLHGLHLEAEDALPRTHVDTPNARLRVVVPVLPRISNHTDFDVLRAHPQVDLRFVGPGDAIPEADLIVLPGSKSTRADLAWLRAQGWETAIARHLRYGGKVLGICGGLQMLGRRVADPLGIEGDAGNSDGLGWLELDTTLAAEKQLRQVAGTLRDGAAVTGYEIHCGISTGPALESAWITLDDGRDEGAGSTDDRVRGTYLHGVFDAPPALASLLAWAGLENAEPLDMHALREATLERLADTIASHLDTAALARLTGTETV